MKAQCLSLDRISNLPLNIIQTILTLMPIQDAFRTSILSRKWRYNCINIPKLEFDDKQLEESTDFQLSDKFKIFRVVYNVLLLHNDPVLEFSLCLVKSCYEIDRIILYLSRNANVEKFTLSIGRNGGCYKLPSSFFSLQKLTHLKLDNCAIEPLVTIIGLSTLTSLWLANVSISKNTLLRLLSYCPLLKSFTLISYYGIVTFVELFRCLPSIEQLHMDFNSFLQCCSFSNDILQWKLTNMFVHLRVLQLSKLLFAYETELSHVLLLVTSSPNIEKLKLEMHYDPDKAISETAMYHFDIHDYSDIILNNLREMEITNFSNRKPVMDFVKLILTKSPMLKSVRIVIIDMISVNDEVKMLRDLLWIPRASTGAQIKFERP